VSTPYGAPPQPPYPPYGSGPPAWGWPVAPPRRDPVDWRVEGFIAVVGTLFLAISGAIAGLLWDGAAPKLSIQKLAASSDAVFHAQIGADAWFLLVTVLVGLVTAIVLCAVAGRPGPGVAVALAVGGLLGSLVADRVGFVAERHVTVGGLHALGVHAGGDLVSEIDFRVRALGVVVGWPLVALAVLGIFVGIDALRRH
jgi:hypothetical protein